MQKRFIVIGVVAGVCAAAVATGIIVASQKQGGSPFNFLGTSQMTPTPAPTNAPKLLTWDDPAGFTFQYPEGLTLNKHDEDNENYAHVEMTNAEHPGSIIVWAKDTTSADITAWVKTQKGFTAAPIIDTSLGGTPAKKVSLTNPDKLITATISEELLFMIEASLSDKPYWTNVHDTIANSFKFTPLTGSSGTDTGATVGEAADEEEVLQ